MMIARAITGHSLAVAMLALGTASCATGASAAERRFSTFPPGATACSFGPNWERIRLKPNEHCFALIQARLTDTVTPVEVAPCERYRIAVPPNQYWFDAGLAPTPPIGLDGNWIMNTHRRWKRVPTARWFALIGTVVEPGSSKPVQAAQDLSDPDGAELTVTQPGQLNFYPNDAIAPWANFYGNNSGEIWIKISRIEDACTR